MKFVLIIIITALFILAGCSTTKPAECDSCPLLSQPSPDWCSGGKIIDGEKDRCGCQLPPKCELVACTEEAKICPDGSAVGRVGPDCEFSPCPSSDQTKKNICTARSNGSCTAEFHPVCGWFDSSIKCIRYPCAINAGNPCIACSNVNVEYWTEGNCPDS